MAAAWAALTVGEALARQWPALVVTALVVICAWRLLPGKAVGPKIASCDFESFYWAARKRLGRRFHSLRHGNRASAAGVEAYAWAVPNKEALACIGRHVRELPPESRHIVDFGAGAGYWSLQVKKYLHFMAVEGVQVTALDNHPELYDRKAWYPIEHGDLESLNSLTDVGLLLLVWPPCWEDMAMKAMEAFSGNLVAYIGEARGGCTAGHSFFDALEQDWVEMDHVKIPNWYGRSDCLYMYQRATWDPEDLSSHRTRRGSERSMLQNPQPHASAGPPRELLLPFFRGTGVDIHGRRLAEMREYDFYKMEMLHDYILWMFPTEEESAFVLDAPVLTREHLQAFRDEPCLRRELQLNLARFCEFLGLELRGGGDANVRVVRSSAFAERIPDCWTAMFGSNHHWFGISRTLHCLGLCSLPREQSAFMECLEEIFKAGLAKCDSAMPHWRARAQTAPSLR